MKADKIEKILVKKYTEKIKQGIKLAGTQENLSYHLDMSSSYINCVLSQSKKDNRSINLLRNTAKKVDNWISEQNEKERHKNTLKMHRDDYYITQKTGRPVKNHYLKESEAVLKILRTDKIDSPEFKLHRAAINTIDKLRN